MLNTEQTLWVLDCISGSGRVGELLMKRKDGFAFKEAVLYPSCAEGKDFRWGIANYELQYCALRDFALDIKSRIDCGRTFCLFRECDFHKNDPCVMDEECGMVFAEDNIFYLLDETCDDRKIAMTMKTANKFLLMCEFYDSSIQLHNGDSITYEEFDRLLDHLTAVAVGICDDEGVCYVPYRRTLPL